MFWFGLIVGITIGVFCTFKVFSWTFAYLGEHPEQLNKLIDDNIKRVLQRAETRVKQNLDRNPFV